MDDVAGCELDLYRGAEQKVNPDYNITNNIIIIMVERLD